MRYLLWGVINWVAEFVPRLHSPGPGLKSHPIADCSHFAGCRHPRQLAIRAVTLTRTHTPAGATPACTRGPSTAARRSAATPTSCAPRRSSSRPLSPPGGIGRLSIGFVELAHSATDCQPGDWQRRRLDTPLQLLFLSCPVREPQRYPIRPPPHTAGGFASFDSCWNTSTNTQGEALVARRTSSVFILLRNTQYGGRRQALLILLSEGVSDRWRPGALPRSPVGPGRHRGQIDVVCDTKRRPSVSALRERIAANQANHSHRENKRLMSL